MIENTTDNASKRNSNKTEIIGELVPLTSVKVKPKFEDGDHNNFNKWVFRNLEDPESAKKDGIQGRITLSFTLDKQGYVKDVKILRGINKALDDEAVRVVSMSPRWEPGMPDGEPVNVRFTFPVIFQIR